MFQFSARSIVCLSLTGIAVSMLSVTIWLGLAPNRDQAVREGRARIAETLAISSAAFVSRGDVDSLRALLDTVVMRDPALESAGLRGRSGEMLLATGDHATLWVPRANGLSTERFVQLPLQGETQPIGQLELVFHSDNVEGLPAIFINQWTAAVAVVCGGCFALFSLYLTRMMKALDPSKAVPAQVRAALDNLAEGLLVIDCHGRVVLANQSFALMLGVGPEKLVGRKAASFEWLRATASPWTPPWMQALERQQAVANVALQLRDANAAVRTFMVNCSPVLGTDGKYRGVFTSFDDVTMLENKKAELHTAMEAAESANQAKSQFLANMSHEIRTPMNAILGFTDVLRRGIVETEQDKSSYLDTIHRSGKYLLELINDILDLSKVESGHFEVESTDTRPHDVVQEVVTVLGVRAREKGLTLEYLSAGEIPEVVQSDPTRLRQIITNLVGNALKFTERGGVQVVSQYLPGQKNSRLQIDIIDSGIGMPAETLHRIFNPFEQADSSVTRKFGGTGLGLAISRNFARHMGGDITVQSELGRGSIFTVVIEVGDVAGVRRMDAATARRESRDRQLEVVDPGKLHLRPSRILVVDDGEANRQLISLVLKRAGLTVDVACNGQEGVDAFGQQQFDLVLMDMQMPIKDGYTATRELRALGIQVPIVALTGNAMQGDEEKCMEAGCSGFLTKPVDIDALMRLLAGELGTLTAAEVAELEMVNAHARQSTADEVKQSMPVMTLKSPPLVPESDSRTEALMQPEPDMTEQLRLQGKTEPVVVEAKPSNSLADLEHMLQQVDALLPQVARPATTKRRPLVSTLPMDDAEFREIVVGFVRRLDEKLDDMRFAWANNNLEALASLAHWLKGAGGTVGFAAFSEPAKQLEMACRSGNRAQIDGILNEIEELARSIQVGGESFSTSS